VCWDLDNTLVDSGSLIRAGAQLQAAIIDAQPVPHMLELYQAVRRKLPGASHFILTARPRSMRPQTLEWLGRHRVPCGTASVCFLPDARAKPRVWRRLARGARLVILDDLSYEHERPEVSVYEDLVDAARRIASVYVGLAEIRQIASNSEGVDAAASLIARAVAEDGDTCA
jgi:hypothetical protein